MEILEFIVITTVVLASLIMLGWISAKRQLWTTTIPGLDPEKSLKGNFQDIARAGSLHEFLTNLHEKYGPIAKFWWGPKMTVSIASPKLFKEHAKPFDRPVEFFEMFSPVIGSSSIQLTSGSDGRRRHAAYSKCFTNDALHNYYGTFMELSREFVDAWKTLPMAEHIPLRQTMLDNAIKAILWGSCGKYFNDTTKINQIRQAYESVIDALEEYVGSDGSDMEGVSQKGYAADCKILHNTMLECIEDRRQNPPTAAEYLLIDAVLELDMAEEVTESDLVTMFVGGFHTSAATLIWGLYVLANNPDVQEQVYEEVTRILGNEPIDMDKMKKLTYLQQVLDETLRCFVVAPYAARVQDCEINLGGHKIPAGTPVVHALGVVLKDASIYPDPERFDPERFSPEASKSRLNFSFEPFGFAGKRICPGYRFALMEVKVLFSEILRKFRISLVDGQKIVPNYGIITFPTDEIWVTISPREI